MKRRPQVAVVAGVLVAAATVVVAAATVVAVAAPCEVQDQTFGAVVEVKRLLLEVRVTDASGEPVAGLTPADFQVTAGGHRLEVESVTWVPTSTAAAPPVSVVTQPAGSAVPAAREPRLVVVVFQTDINHYRMRGAMRMAPRAARFVRGLEDGDLVALFTFESHLELRADFTADREGLAELLTTSEILEATTSPPTPALISVAETFDESAARRAATLSYALELVGRALIPIEGPKMVVLFGWGLGRYNPGHPVIERGSYYPAIGALSAARAAVFTLDISSADWHTLEHGLRTLSHDTGGLYLKTHQFPDSAVERLTRTISSYYELAVVVPEESVDLTSLEVDVSRRGVTVLYRRPLPHIETLPDSR